MSLDRLAISIPEAGQLLGISRSNAYARAKSGELPTVKLGARILVPVARLEKLLAGESMAIPSGPNRKLGS